MGARHVWITRRLKGILCCVLLSLSSAAGENLVVNGEFELDGPGTNLPTGWTSVEGGPPGWDGTSFYGAAGGGHPYARPGLNDVPFQSKCYGDVLEDGASTGATLSQVVGSGDPGETTVGGWTYLADAPGSFIRFRLRQPDSGVEWVSPAIYQICGGDACWTWHEFVIPEGYGFASAGEVILSLDLQTAFGVGAGIHGVMVDGVELHSPGLATGACCLSDGSCTDVDSEATCLALDSSATWGGDDSSCDTDINENGRSDVCEACALNQPFADADGDGDVDQEDLAVMQTCYTGQSGFLDPVLCSCYDANTDNRISQVDLLSFEACASGPGVPADPGCDD